MLCRTLLWLSPSGSPENIDSSFGCFDLSFYRVIFVFGSRHLKAKRCPLFVEVGGVYLFLAEYIGYYNQLAVASGEPTIPALPTPLSLIFPDVLPEVREAEERIFQRVENALTSP